MHIVNNMLEVGSFWFVIKDWKPWIYTECVIHLNIEKVGENLSNTRRAIFVEDNFGFSKINFLPKDIAKEAKAMNNTPHRFLIVISHRSEIIGKE